MVEIWSLLLCFVLLFFVAASAFMARPHFFPTGERISVAGFSLSLCLVTFFLLTQLAGVSVFWAGLMAISAPTVGWFEPEIEKYVLRHIFRFKDPGLNHEAPDK